MAGHRVRTQYGVKASAGQKRGDVEIVNYLQDDDGSRNLVFDLSITTDTGVTPNPPQRLAHTAPGCPSAGCRATKINN